LALCFGSVVASRAPRCANCSLLWVEMNSRQQRLQRKMLEWQLAQSPSHGPSAASVQPDSKSNPQENLQTQDW
ncbi:hypothetical protein STEG23_021285, partial [Scotinomys teguina]